MPSQPRTQRTPGDMGTPAAPAPNAAGNAEEHDKQMSSSPPSPTAGNAQDDDEQSPSPPSSPIIHLSSSPPHSFVQVRPSLTGTIQVRGRFFDLEPSPGASISVFEPEKARSEQERSAINHLRLRYVLGDERSAIRDRLPSPPETPLAYSSGNSLGQFNHEYQQKMRNQRSMVDNETTPSRSNPKRRKMPPADTDFGSGPDFSSPGNVPAAATPEAGEGPLHTPGQSLSELLALSTELHAGLLLLSQETNFRGKKRRSSS